MGNMVLLQMMWLACLVTVAGDSMVEALANYNVAKTAAGKMSAKDFVSGSPIPRPIGRWRRSMGI
jgi:hypothetical protein